MLLTIHYRREKDACLGISAVGRAVRASGAGTCINEFK